MNKKKTESGRTWKLFSSVNTGLSLADRLWSMLVFFFVAAGGAGSGYMAKLDPVLKGLGPIYWFGIALLTSLILSVGCYLVMSGFYKRSMASYYDRLAVPKTQINPLDDSFKDSVIYVEDLRLPGVMLHSGKQFKRCKFVGPGTLALMGGTCNASKFTGCADAVVVPYEARLTGVVALKECFIDECEFISITLIVDPASAATFSAAGISVKGFEWGIK